MPRRKTAVKNKLSYKKRKNASSKEGQLWSTGAIDIHFHGAFGIDLMQADEAALDILSERLWENGVAAFCPTTLSMPHASLVEAVSRIGSWIVKTRGNPAFSGAIPLGIHLEGPYISPDACGAHPPEVLRKLSWDELDELWEQSKHTLKILTIAPETLSDFDKNKLPAWAKSRKIVLSVGHSKASAQEAVKAFQSGFQGVTHAWNALGFHHRAPGTLGAAIGNPKVYLELILDQIHVSPEVVSWTRKLHSAERICFVSDCIPAASTPAGSWHSFGSLQVQVKNGAGRLATGHLAGGGRLLPELFKVWVENEARVQQVSLKQVLRDSIPSLAQAQLRALKIPTRLLATRKGCWKVGRNGQIRFDRS